MVRLKIPYKFPSMNQYIEACRRNRYVGAKMKRQIQDDIGWYINTLPEFKEPVIIDFTWIETNRKRDLDNISFAKKFILDALVEQGKLINDGQSWVTAFRDTFCIGDDNGVILDITETQPNHNQNET